MKSINVYDFDGTIYDGDSSIDFFKFMLKRNKRIVKRVFPILWAGVLYKLKIKSKEHFKSVFFGFVQDVDAIDEQIDDFWKIYGKKIKSFYIKAHRNDDMIISASPKFLLVQIAKEMSFNLIATDVDKKTGKLLSKNCYGEEKVTRFAKEHLKISKFYSDSLSDAPLAKIAKEAFLVRGEKIASWPEDKR